MALLALDAGVGMSFHLHTRQGGGDGFMQGRRPLASLHPCRLQNFLHKWDRRGNLQSLSGDLESTPEMSTVDLLFRCGRRGLPPGPGRGARGEGGEAGWRAGVW